MFIYQKWIFRADLQANPRVLYLFGDNLIRVGLGGQAKEMRGEPNAVGIATKMAPGMAGKDFFTDARLLENENQLDDDFRRAFAHVYHGGTVVVPLDGLGTGFSELPKRAPLTNAYLEAALERLATAAG